MSKYSLLKVISFWRVKMFKLRFLKVALVDKNYKLS
jgi:hypothetical protein